MIKFIKKHNKYVLVVSFTIVFSISYYISIVGASLVIINPKTAVKASIVNTVNGDPVEISIFGSLKSLDILPQADEELMSMILEDIYLDAVITYDDKIEEIDFSIHLKSSSYQENMLEILGYSQGDRVYFSENKLLKGDFYFMKEPFQENCNIEELIDKWSQNVTRKGLKEYTTNSGDKSYANVFELSKVIGSQTVLLELLVNNKMKIVHFHFVINDDFEKVIDIEADVKNVKRKLHSQETSHAKLFEFEQLLDILPDIESDYN